MLLRVVLLQAKKDLNSNVTAHIEMEKQLMECQTSTIQSTSIEISLQWLIVVVIFVLSALLLFSSCFCTRGSTKKKPQKFQRVAVRKEATDLFKNNLSIVVPQRQRKQQPVTKLNKLLTSHEQDIKKQGYSDSADRVQNNSAQHSKAKKQQIQEELAGASQRLQQRLQKRQTSNNKNRRVLKKKEAPSRSGEAMSRKEKVQQVIEMRKKINYMKQLHVKSFGDKKKKTVKNDDKIGKRIPKKHKVHTLEPVGNSIELPATCTEFDDLDLNDLHLGGLDLSGGDSVFRPESSTGAAAEENARKEKASNTLNEDLNRVHSIESLYIERRFDKDSIEKIRIEVVSRVKTEKKLAQIFNQIDLDKSNSIDRKEFHSFLTAALEELTDDVLYEKIWNEDVLFEKIWNIVLGIGDENGEMKNDMTLLDQSGYKRELDRMGLKRWVFGSE